MTKKTLSTIVLLWLAWVIIILSFQWLVTARLEIKHPDLAVVWTKTETLPSSNKGKIYLLEPFLNRQVAWDSEYYVGIAVAGYNDPKAGTVIDPANGRKVIKNYSFFPFYPYVMRVFGFLLKLF